MPDHQSPIVNRSRSTTKSTHLARSLTRSLRWIPYRDLVNHHDVVKSTVRRLTFHGVLLLQELEAGECRAQATYKRRRRLNTSNSAK